MWKALSVYGHLKTSVTMGALLFLRYRFFTTLPYLFWVFTFLICEAHPRVHHSKQIIKLVLWNSRVFSRKQHSNLNLFPRCWKSDRVTQSVMKSQLYVEVKRLFARCMCWRRRRTIYSYKDIHCGGRFHNNSVFTAFIGRATVREKKRITPES